VREQARESKEGVREGGGQGGRKRELFSRAACAPERTCERMCEKGGWEARILAGETLACSPNTSTMAAASCHHLAWLSAFA